jgi:hypothetical protein
MQPPQCKASLNLGLLLLLLLLLLASSLSSGYSLHKSTTRCSSKAAERQIFASDACAR